MTVRAGVTVYGPADFSKGEVFATRRGRYQVLPLNPKSITVRWLDAPENIPETCRTGTLPYDQLVGLRRG